MSKRAREGIVQVKALINIFEKCPELDEDLMARAFVDGKQNTFCRICIEVLSILDYKGVKWQ